MLVVTAAELNPGLCESVMGDPRRTPRFNYLLRLTGFSICCTNSCNSLQWKNAQQNWQRGDTEVTVWGNGQASTRHMDVLDFPASCGNEICEGAQCLRLHPSSAGSMSLITGWGTKVLSWWLRLKHLPAVQETWVGKIPWRKEKLPTPVQDDPTSPS